MLERFAISMGQRRSHFFAHRVKSILRLLGATRDFGLLKSQLDITMFGDGANDGVFDLLLYDAIVRDETPSN